MRAICDDGTEIFVNANGTWAHVAPNSVPTRVILPPRVGDPSTSSASSTSTSTTTGSEDGFRGVSWRSTVKQCIDREGTEPDGTGENHVFWEEVAMADLAWMAVYLFVEGELGRGKYMLSQEFSNPQRYVLEYGRMSELLKTKYGEPNEEQNFWTGDLYMDSPGEWGMAVKTGELTRYMTWETEQTKISLILSGENYESSLVVEYISCALEDREEQLKSARVLSDL